MYKMIMENLLQYENLVYSIVGKYGGYFDKDDLYQAGMLGLIDAYKHFNNNFDIKFSSYAYYYILGEVTKFVRENRNVKVSKDIIKLSQSIEKTKDVMRQRLGREPTDTEVSLFLEIDEEKIGEVNELMQEVKSLDFAFEEDISLYNSIKTFDKGMNDDILDLRTAISYLNDDEKQLLLVRYYQDMTQTEASKQLGMSQVQVSRKEGKILEKLKQQL